MRTEVENMNKGRTTLEANLKEFQTARDSAMTEMVAKDLLAARVPSLESQIADREELIKRKACELRRQRHAQAMFMTALRSLIDQHNERYKTLQKEFCEDNSNQQLNTRFKT